jgi:hypothetical protein
MAVPLIEKSLGDPITEHMRTDFICPVFLSDLAIMPDRIN